LVGAGRRQRAPGGRLMEGPVKTRKRGGWSGSDDVDRLIGHRLKQERQLAGKTREELGVRSASAARPFAPMKAAKYGCRRIGLPPPPWLWACRCPCSFTPDDQDLPSDDEEETDSRQRLAIRRPAAVLDRPGYAEIRPNHRRAAGDARAS
jgi:hypothetical protein